MSKRDGGAEDEREETVSERVEKVQRALEPLPGRKSRLGYPNIDDFAALIGTTRSRVIAWKKGRAYPQKNNRLRLAELSAGRYEPDDFAPPSLGDLEDAHQQELGTLRGEVDDALARMARDMRALARRVRALELRFPQQTEGNGQQSAGPR